MDGKSKAAKRQAAVLKPGRINAQKEGRMLNPVE